MRKILFLAANPSGTTHLRLGEEVRDIEIGLKQALYRDDFKFVHKSAVRIKDLRQSLLEESPQIVHFSGHGEGEEGLVFEDEVGQSALVSTEALVGLFELFSDSVECVLLNGCYSKIQAEGIFENINCVIGMSQAISDRAAIEFAVSFYAALGARKTYNFSYRFARNAIQGSTTSLSQRSIRKSTPVDPAGNPLPVTSSGEHLIPVLLMRPSQASTSTEIERSQQVEERKAALEANLQAVKIKAAAEERLENLNQKIDEEEGKLQEAAATHIRETANWLKEHSSTLAYEAKLEVSKTYSDIFNALPEYKKEDFDWGLEKYIESVYFSILSDSSDRYDLLDEPVVRPSVKSFDVYQTAFEYIKNRIPPRFDSDAKDAISKRFDYLLSILSSTSFP